MERASPIGSWPKTAYHIKYYNNNNNNCIIMINSNNNNNNYYYYYSSTYLVSSCLIHLNYFGHFQQPIFFPKVHHLEALSNIHNSTFQPNYGKWIHLSLHSRPHLCLLNSDAPSWGASSQTSHYVLVLFASAGIMVLIKPLIKMPS